MGVDGCCKGRAGKARVGLERPSEQAVRLCHLRECALVDSVGLGWGVRGKDRQDERGATATSDSRFPIPVSRRASLTHRAGARQIAEWPIGLEGDRDRLNSTVSFSYAFPFTNTLSFS